MSNDFPSLVHLSLVVICNQIDPTVEPAAEPGFVRQFRRLVRTAPSSALAILERAAAASAGSVTDASINSLLGTSPSPSTSHVDVALHGWDLTEVPVSLTAVGASVCLTGWVHLVGTVHLHASLTRLELVDVPALEDEPLAVALSSAGCALDSLRLSAAPLLTGARWYPAALALPTLTTLTLADCARFGSVPLEITESSGCLSQLSLSRCASATDTIVVHSLAACPRLLLLDLSFNPQLTERSLLAIVASKALPTLKVLILWDFPTVRPSAVTLLAKRVRTLKTLSLGSVPSALDESAVVSLLASCARTLTSLTLWSCPLTTSTATRLALGTATRITSLSLVALPRLSDGALAGVLDTLSATLVDLTLKELNIGNGALEGLASGTLRDLTISKCPRVGWGDAPAGVADTASSSQPTRVFGVAAAVAGCPRLRSLSLPASAGLTDSPGLLLGAQHAPSSLTSLNLQGARGLGAAECEAWLRACPSLRRVVLDGGQADVLTPLRTHAPSLTSLSANWLSVIAPATVLPVASLTMLSLAGCLTLTDAQLLPTLEQSQPFLTTLNLSACRSLSPALWQVLARRGTKISWLALAQVPNIFEGTSDSEDGDGLSRYFGGPAARYLRRLDVAGAASFPPRLLLALPTTAPCLRELDIAAIPLEPEVVEEVVRRASPSLREVRASGIAEDGWERWPLTKVTVKG